ncbi:MAG: HEAT repeat domain-containing protein, partial [Planctomycetes bacterium]|nr:HEAT repeat domain-containing protein [Planctomycetota bacterium]
MMCMAPWMTLAGESPAAQEGAATKEGAAAERGATGEAASPEATPEDVERYRSALETLRTSTQTRELVSCMRTLEDEYPATRALLVQATTSPSSRLRAFALKILGENGSAEADLAAVSPCLKDRAVDVRLAAVMALQRLGQASPEARARGYPALEAYLAGETDVNNRKMAVKTIQRWEQREAIPFLVKLLKTEKDRGVRNF